MEAAARQSCPNCNRSHDVSVYVTGQKFACPCGIRFEVVRSTSGRPAGAPEPEALAPTVVPSRPEQTGADATIAPRAHRIPGYELLELLG
ncbi:MAG: hypothetical protein ACK4N5_07555, partial [Myxococcales bacterium]